MRHACGVHGARTVTTATGDGYRHITYRELGQHAAQLANALRAHRHHRRPAGRHVHVEQRRTLDGLPRGAVDGRGSAYPQHPALPRADRLRRQRGRRPGRRWSTCRWPSLLGPVLPSLDTVHTVIAVGEGDLSPLQESGKTVLRYADVIGGEPTEFDWPQIDEQLRGRDVLHQWHHRQPQRRRLQPPFELPAHDGGLHRATAIGTRCQRQRAADRADVPCQRVGAAVRGVDGRRRLGATRLPSRRRVADRHDRDRCGPRLPARCRPSGTTSCTAWRRTRTTTSRRCGW